MIFTFSSRGMNQGEWDNIIKAVGAEHIEFYDKKHRWFLQDHWPERIAEAVAKHGSPKLVLGSSQGGWAGLHYQHIIKANTVLAFNPQVTTVPEEMEAMKTEKNMKWGRRIRGAELKTSQLPAFNGLFKPVVYFGKNSNDVDHRKLAIAKGYPIIDVDCDDHNLPGWFHQQGKLVDIIKNLYYNG